VNNITLTDHRLLHKAISTVGSINHHSTSATAYWGTWSLHDGNHALHIGTYETDGESRHHGIYDWR
jgi:hypothetical protein